MSDPVFDCRACAACCHARDGTILVTLGDKTRWAASGRQDLLDQLAPGHFSLDALAMRDGHCVHLGLPGYPNDCSIYETRPATCADFQAGSRQCLEARRARGFVDPSISAID